MDSEEAMVHAKRIADAIMDLDDYDLVEMVATGNPHILVPFLKQWHGEDAAKVGQWAAYEIRCRFVANAQRRALPLLRRFLTPKQRRELARHITFPVVGSDGGRYLLAPHGSYIARTLRFEGGRYWHAVIRFCYHDPESVMCYADEMIGTMFRLMTDEAGWLAEANASVMTRWAHRPEVQALLASIQHR